MPDKPSMTVKEYLDQLKETKKSKPPQIQDALNIYIDLWDRVIEKGVISEADEIDLALSKIDEAGGLMQATY